MKLYFATGNSGKIKHVEKILPEGFKVEQLDLETIEPSENIEEIAKSKVKQAEEKTDLEDHAFLIADDSGIFIESLNGFPGPQTSFFDEKVGRANILKLLDGKSKEAEFRAAIALKTPEGKIKIFTGSKKGTLVEPRGGQGFGYDPLFLPEDRDQTWGENVNQKDESSHRQKALDKLREFLINNHE